MGPTSADADLWGHVRFGLDMLSTGGLPSIDPYAFTSDVAWVNHEWLAEAIFAAGYKAAGALGLIAIKLAVLAAIVLIAQRSLDRDVKSPVVRDALTGLLVLGTFARTGFVRPQLFSVLAFVMLVSALRSADREGSKRIAFLPLLFACWANLHGAWITGLFVTAVWCALSPAFTWPRRATLFAGCALATLANPYGVGLWRFLHQTVGASRPEILDWVPLLSLPWPVVAYECLLPALAVGAILKTRRITLAYGAVLAVLAIATFRISRVDAFLHCAIVLLLAPQFDAWLGRTSAPEERRQLAWLSVPVFALSAAIASRGWIPVTGSWAPDPDALPAVAAAASGSRVVTWFDWGEYAIWHLAPGMRVSIDGRRETTYSAKLQDQHLRFYFDADGGASLPATLSADYVWIPPHLPAARRLDAEGWRRVYEDGDAVVFARRQSPSRERAVMLAAATPPGSATFPGP
jgi:hypothetical protein